MQHKQLAATVPQDMAGRRLDQVLAELFPQYSRSRLQQWLRDGLIKVDSAMPRARDKVVGGERIEVTAAVTEEAPWEGEPIPLAVVHEDEALIVVDKPCGLVVHPAAGNRSGTLVNALLHYAPQLAGVPRAGIVHRLDKDTSGLMVVARSLEAHAFLVDQIQRRLVSREYLALVYGELVSGGRVDEPVGRHPVHRQRMAVTPTGKPAATRYRVVERFKGFTLVRAALETGRTHQIRVHMAHLNHPLVGDPVYGRLRIPKGAAAELAAALRGFKRQALHAEHLGLTHPSSGRPVEWRASLPGDLSALLQVLHQCADGDQAPS